MKKDPGKTTFRKSSAKTDQRPIREYFDPAPMEKASAGETEKKKSEREEEQDALRSYFREMGDLPQLSVEEETALWQQIDSSVTQLRASVCRFAFVYREHIKLLNNPETDLADIFPLSASGDGPMLINPGKRKEWCAEIEKIYKKLTDAYRKKGSPEKLEQIRQSGIEVFNRYPAVLGELLEWNDVAKRYLENFNSGRISSEELEEIMMLDRSDIIRMIQSNETLYAELEKLKLRMLETNLRLVINIAKHYQHKGLPFSDLIPPFLHIRLMVDPSGCGKGSFRPIPCDKAADPHACHHTENEYRGKEFHSAAGDRADHRRACPDPGNAEGTGQRHQENVSAVHFASGCRHGRFRFNDRIVSQRQGIR